MITACLSLNSVDPLARRHTVLAYYKLLNVIPLNLMIRGYTTSVRMQLRRVEFYVSLFCASPADGPSAVIIVILVFMPCIASKNVNTG